ncbi:MAG: PQQ-binding-like beta-propeller repeat protein [Pyrinomonadaceae bacterium]
MRKSPPVWKIVIFLILFSNLPETFAQSFAQPLRQCWKLETETLRNAQIASDNENSFFIPLPEGIVKAVNIKNGETIWQSEVGGEITSPLLFEQNSLYVISEDNSENISESISESQVKQKTYTLRSLSFLTGITQWKKEFKGTSASAMYLSSSSENLCIVTDRGYLYLLDKRTGKIVDEKSLDIQISNSSDLRGNRLYIGSSDNRILAVTFSGSLSDVEELRKLKYAPTIITPAVGGDFLYVGDRLGNVSAIGIKEKKLLWESRAGADITSITELADKLLVSSSDNYIYLLSRKNGNRVWKKRLAGRNSGMPPVKDGVAVFSPLGERTATFLELLKGKQVNQISLNETKGDDNFFTDGPNIAGDVVILSTLNGFYAFSSGSNCGTATMKKVVGLRN